MEDSRVFVKTSKNEKLWANSPRTNPELKLETFRKEFLFRIGFGVLDESFDLFLLHNFVLGLAPSYF